MTRPGRNDPCPCGSGRKYKTCCLNADRRARRSGAGGLLLTHEMIESARREEVWQTELVPFAASFENDPGARPTVALVTAGELVVWADVHGRVTGDPAEVAGLLADAVVAAVERLGRAPSRIEARYAEVVSTLRDRLGDLDVDVSVAHRLPDLDAAASRMVQHMEGRPPDERGLSRPCASSAETWEGWVLRGSTVADLFEAAAAFHRARPWRGLDDVAPVEIETPEGRRWAATVLGAGGIEYGLSIYSDPGDRDSLMQPFGGTPDIGAFRGRCLSLTLNRAENLPETMRREVMRAGWSVASPDAHPYLVTINTPGGGVTETDAGDLAAALRAVAAAGSALSRAWAVGGGVEWRDPDTGSVVRMAGTSTGAGTPPLEGEGAGPAADPAVVERLDELLSMLAAVARREGLPADLLEEAVELIRGYAAVDPDAFLAGRKLEIVAAASLHAAGLLLETPWSGWRPTLEELAERFDVSTASISNRSLEMRESVPRPTGFDRMMATAASVARQRVEDAKARGADPRAMMAAAGFRVPPGPFDLEELARATGLGEPEKGVLASALRQAVEEERRSRERDPDGRPLVHHLRTSTAFGAGLREVMRDAEAPPGARDALARWVLSRLAVAEPSGEVVPRSSLLALAHLAGEGVLREALAGAVLMALTVGLGPAEDLDPAELHPLVRAVGTDPELEPSERARLLWDLLERTGWGRDGRRGPSFVELLAAEEAISRAVRREALTRISGWEGEVPDRFVVGPATHRRALVLRAEMEERPEALVGSLLEAEAPDAAPDEGPALVAAELLRSHGSALSREEVEELVRRGLGHPRPAVRQAFYRAGRAFLGGDILEWAPEDVLERARRDAGRRPGGSPQPRDPDQTNLF